ncbi:hypothetical protein CC86DRAFT_74463 [Ophiobolus disseminans]|uniref:Uncharacterized protein n=1 Tax=Ophiobolus disseminans TaxID=1469910 RepID=A0A6A6ZPH0_9PLEO|nr:hypothetical protein CC86DRAFT_74463 [Ophiobolus disseminans]
MERAPNLLPVDRKVRPSLYTTPGAHFYQTPSYRMPPSNNRHTQARDPLPRTNIARLVSQSGPSSLRSSHTRSTSILRLAFANAPLVQQARLNSCRCPSSAHNTSSSHVILCNNLQSKSMRSLHVSTAASAGCALCVTPGIGGCRETCTGPAIAQLASHDKRWQVEGLLLPLQNPGYRHRKVQRSFRNAARASKITNCVLRIKTAMVSSLVDFDT